MDVLKPAAYRSFPEGLIQCGVLASGTSWCENFDSDKKLVVELDSKWAVELISNHHSNQFQDPLVGGLWRFGTPSSQQCVS
ncbi:hypothetical protein Sjap_008428 [Stephania japonica]|uniref:Uncharacterized protein n=1 Tax=Stephania japonica TaxID=461633 RepID=A0AAP0JPY1_9MAGN